MGTYWDEYDTKGGTQATCPPGSNTHLNLENGQCQRGPSCANPVDLPQMCPIAKQDGEDPGNPLLPVNGEKFMREIDISLPAPHSIPFERIYRSGRVGGSSLGLARATTSTSTSTSSSSSSSTSTSSTTSTGGTSPDFDSGIDVPEEILSGSIYQNRRLSALGKGWSTNLISRLVAIQATYSGEMPPGFPLGWVTIDLGNGNYRKFKPTASGWGPVSETPGKL